MVAGSTVPARAFDTPGQPLVGDDWRDPRLKALHLTVPAFRGRYYPAEIPDTLDLTDRARLSVNAMTRLLNPQYDYTQFQVAELRSSPPVLILAAGGLTVLNPKWAEALPLMRMMTGSTENADIDHH